MALWQFKMIFVPTEYVGAKTCLTELEYEEEPWGDEMQPPEDFQQQLAAILPRKKSWADELMQWGTQTGDLIEIWTEGGTVVSVTARFDCRKLNEKFMREIFDLSRDWGFRLVYNRHRTVLPDNWEEFVRAVRESPNLKFMQDPAEWLAKLAKEVEEQEGNR